MAAGSRGAFRCFGHVPNPFDHEQKFSDQGGARLHPGDGTARSFRAAGWIGGNAPAGLGVHDGRLKPPSTTPNSVSSQADLYPDRPQARRAAIEPLAFSGDGLQAMRRLAAVLQRHERTRIVQDDGDYLRAEARSETLGFVDDLEFWLDRANGVIQVRSASRLGYGDRDVNRTRIEALRGAFARDAARRTAGRPAVRTVGLG